MSQQGLTVWHTCEGREGAVGGEGRAVGGRLVSAVLVGAVSVLEPQRAQDAA